MDIKIVGETSSPVPVVTSISPSEGGTVQDMEYKALGQVLGLETSSSLQKYSGDLKTLVEYAKHNTEDHTPQGLKWAIRSLELRLGTPPLAEDRVKYVTRYAYLVNETRRLEEEKKKFEQQ